MATTQYVGARYVPLFKGEWDNTQTYEPLCIVSNQGNSYTSRQYVPTGISIDNEEYWALTGNYNAQIAAYQAEVDRVKVNYEKAFNTVNDMINDPNIKEGMTVTTLGYYKIGDGGNNLYKIATEESIRAIKTNNGFYAAPLENDNTFNIAKYGFVSNKIFNGSDLSSFISTLPYAATIYVPKGVFNISGPITLVNRVNILGEEVNLADQDAAIGSVLNFTNMASGQSCVTLSNLNSFIKNIKVNANAFTMDENRNNIGEGIDVFTEEISVDNVSGIRIPRNTYGYTIENVCITKASGWGIIGSFYNIINNVSIYNCKFGIVCNNDCMLSNIRAVKTERAINLSGALTVVNNVRCDSISSSAIYISANGCIVNNVQVDYSQGPAIKINDANNIQISNVTGRCGTLSPANKDTLLNDCSTNTNSNGCVINVSGNSNCKNITIEGIYKQSNPLDTPSSLIVPKNFVIINGDGKHTVFITQGALTENINECTASNIKCVVNTINNAHAVFSGNILGEFVTGKNNSFKKQTTEAVN